MSTLNLYTLFETHKGNIQNAISALGNLTQYTEIEANLDEFSEEETAGLALISEEDSKNREEFVVDVICQIIKNKDHKLKAALLEWGFFVSCKKVKELAEVVANSTNPPQILINKNDTDKYETLALFLILNHFDFLLVRSLSEAGVDISIGECNNDLKTTKLTTESIVKSTDLGLNEKIEILSKLKKLGVDIDKCQLLGRGVYLTLTAVFVKNNPNDIPKILPELKKLDVDIHAGTINLRKKKLSLASAIIYYFKGTFQTVLLELGKHDVNIDVSGIISDNARCSLANGIIESNPNNYEDKLKKIGEIGLNVLVGAYYSDGTVSHNNIELLTDDGAKLTKKGVKYFASKQLCKIHGSRPTATVSDSDVLFKTADGKSYTKSDFDKLEKDITPLKVLVESGLMEQYGFRVKDILNPETLEKIRGKFAEDVLYHVHRGQKDLSFEENHNKENAAATTAGNLSRLPFDIANHVAKFLHPTGEEIIFNQNGELIKHDEEIIPGITKNHNVIRLVVSRLYDKIEEKLLNVIGYGYCQQSELKREFINCFLIETAGCKLTIGPNEIKNALAIAEENSNTLSLELARKIATAFLQNQQQKVKSVNVGVGNKFDVEAFYPMKPSSIKVAVKEEIYLFLFRKKYEKLTLEERVKINTSSAREKNIVKKKKWLNKLEESLGENTLWIHREKLVHELKNLSKEELEPMLGFSMESAENLAEFIKVHSTNNSEIRQQAMVAQLVGDGRKRVGENLEQDKDTNKKQRLIDPEESLEATQARRAYRA